MGYTLEEGDGLRFVVDLIQRIRTGVQADQVAVNIEVSPDQERASPKGFILYVYAARKVEGGTAEARLNKVIHPHEFGEFLRYEAVFIAQIARVMEDGLEREAAALKVKAARRAAL